MSGAGTEVIALQISDPPVIEACFAMQQLPQVGEPLPVTEAAWVELHKLRTPGPRQACWLSWARHGQRIEAVVAIVDELACLRGHFPGNPVLPGVIQLLWAEQLLRSAWPAANVAAVRRLKFRIPVGPRSLLRFVLEGSAGTIAARVERPQERIADWTFVCDGTA